MPETEVRSLPGGLQAHLILREPMVIQIPARRAVAPVMNRLMEILQNHPGRHPIRVLASDAESRRLLVPTQFASVDMELIEELTKLLGPTSLWRSGSDPGP